MNYYLDTEFLEGTQTKRFLGIPYGKTKPTIDLISIGIVAEDGREYYAISKEFNLKEAWNRFDLKIHDQTCLNEGGENGDYCYYVNQYEDVQEWKDEHKNHVCLYKKGDCYKEYWIRENVLKPIFDYLLFKSAFDADYPCHKVDTKFTYDNLKCLIKFYGKTNQEIRFEIVNFVHGYIDIGEYYNATINQELKDKPKFYAYFADYDWVAFCWLFGKMMDLPKGFPKYCIDLKQIFDEKQEKYSGSSYPQSKNLKLKDNYPKQTNEHDALADARWNKQLHEFLKSL